MNKEAGFVPPEAQTNKKRPEKPAETFMGKMSKKYRNLAGGVMLGSAVAGGAVEGVKHGKEIGEFAQNQVDELHKGDARAVKNFEKYLNNDPDEEAPSEEKK